MQKVINRTHIEGLLYQHSLELRESGPNSTNPGTKYITGTIEVATDNDCTNIVPVHYTYVTATTSTGKQNPNFATLSNIVNGIHPTVMKDGADKAVKLKIDSAIGLNEFYTERDGQETLVSAKRNEGGFIHIVNALDENEARRSTFEVDMVITNVIHKDADEDRDLPEKAIIRGVIFDFRKAILPVEFSAVNPLAISYFEGLEASSQNPVFTKLRGVQISEVVVKKYTEESAFGEASVREVKSSRKDFQITWAQTDPYLWDDASTLLASELSEAVTARNTYLATLKQRNDEYKASRKAPAAAAIVANGKTFDF